MSGNIALSVVVPTYQRRDSIRRLLAALHEQTLAPTEFEVVVVVDGSTDGTREWLAEQHPPFRLNVLWSPNRGRAAACNRGIAAARGDVLVLLDDDMCPFAECLAAHLEAHAGHERWGIVGAAPIFVDDRADAVKRFVASKFNTHLQKLARPGHEFSPRDFYTGNFSIRRDVLLEVGGFDEDFTRYGNEDVELSVRLRRAGVRLRFEPRAASRQAYEKGLAALANDTVDKGRTSVVLARKHPEVWKQLRLAAFDEAPRTRRFVRAGLLRATRQWPALQGLSVRCAEWLVRNRAPGASLWCDLMLDYLYWCGVRTELARADALDSRLALLANRLAAQPR